MLFEVGSYVSQSNCMKRLNNKNTLQTFALSGIFAATLLNGNLLADEKQDAVAKNTPGPAASVSPSPGHETAGSTNGADINMGEEFKLGEMKAETDCDRKACCGLD
jgi:hypothetical protein